MADDESDIRALIQRWARAVHAGDMDGVLADHADDIVMFDVPPPQNGVRGIEAYRESWPHFFEWQRTAVFEIVTLEITAGTDVAFAHALLRCATPEGLAAGSGPTTAADDRAPEAGRPVGGGARAPLVP